MAALMSVTSGKSYDWLKDEFRSMGGMECIINSVTCDIQKFDSESLFSISKTLLVKIDGSLKVLSDVTYLNDPNRRYLIQFGSSAFIKTILRVMQLFRTSLARFQAESSPERKGSQGLDESMEEGSSDTGLQRTMYNVLLSTLGLFINLTNDNEAASSKIGQMEGLIECVMTVTFKLPMVVRTEQRYDLHVLGLGLIINLVEHCVSNRVAVMNFRTGKDADVLNKDNQDVLNQLIQLFRVRYETARRLEEEHENISHKKVPGQIEDSGRDTSGLGWMMDFSQENDTPEPTGQSGHNDGNDQAGSSLEALYRAEKYMEDNLIGAYVALLIGCLIGDDEHLPLRIKQRLPSQSFSPMIQALSRFLGFMEFTGTAGNRKPVYNVIEKMEYYERLVIET